VLLRSYVSRKAFAIASAGIVISIATALSATRNPTFTKHDKAYYTSHVAF